MAVFFVVFAVLAVLGIAMFSANVLICILLLAGALAGAAASCFEGKRERLYQAILLALCLVLCCCSGRDGNTQIATYEQRLEQIEKQIARGNLDKAKTSLEALEKLCGQKVYLDTAYSVLHMEDALLTRMIHSHGADKILFATDAPWADQKACVEKIQNLSGLSEEEKKQILFENAQYFLGILSN